MSDTPRMGKHRRIWLQDGEDHEKPVTWCQDKINDDDTEYVLASDCNELRALLAEAQHMLAHSRCIDDDATKCPACSLESRIDEAIKEDRNG